MGARCKPAKGIWLTGWTAQGFRAHFQESHPGLHSGFGHVFRFSPYNNPKTLDLGQTMARNGSGTLETGKASKWVGCWLG